MQILIMPGQHSAAISYKIMKTMSSAKVIGPLLIGLGAAIEIAPLRCSTSEILNLASVAAYSAGVIEYKKKLIFFILKSSTNKILVITSSTSSISFASLIISSVSCFD